MMHKLGLTLATALVLAVAGTLGSVSESAAQTAQDDLAIATDISTQANQRKTGNAGQRNVGQRKASPRRATPRNVGQRRATPRNVGQRKASPRKATPRNVGQRKASPRKATPRNVGQRKASPRKASPRKAARRNVGQPRRGLGGVSIRGARRFAVAGRHYSLWRGRYRVRRHGGWRTFVALSALGSLAIGAATYYPYAYINAPAPFCDGLTRDGCQLRWLAVRTVEGPTEFQCVAYCPWR